MKQDVEISQIDRKHEKHRQKAEGREKQLLVSIVNHGIEEPLHGVMISPGSVILLDGFKRLRCAVKIGLGVVPFVSIGDDEATAILAILKLSNAKSLSMLEQAAFVDELKNIHGLTTAEIAQRLERSKVWVLMRLQTLSSMSDQTAGAILSGKFPLYSYLYTLHPFRRLNGCPESKKEIDEFVSLCSGYKLSTRDIELLSDAYFRGGEAMQAQLKSGDLGFCLQELKSRNRIQSEGNSNLLDSEKKIIRDLEIIQDGMNRLSLRVAREGQGQPAFRVQAELLTGGVLSRTEKFTTVLRGFYDRIRQA